MKLVRCEKGHFYDSDKNGSHCPYCAQIERQNAAVPASQPAPVPQAAPAPQPVPAHQAASASQAAPAPQTGPAHQTASASQTRPVYQRFPEEPSEEGNRTVGYYSHVMGVEPVVGWLVCIQGPYKGKSFTLKSGRNFIGRAANMDVVLPQDPGVSRIKHAAVIYEPHERQFLVAAGDSRELCYLNHKVVITGQPMEAYDVLELGSTSLMLIPCCGERFSWEEGLQKKEPEENGQ